jgi:hypothetical protein
MSLVNTHEVQREVAHHKELISKLYSRGEQVFAFSTLMQFMERLSEILSFP